MIACNMADDVENQVVSKKLFHATIDDESTRTFVDEKIRLRWTEGDVISLFEGTTRNKQYKFLGETGDNAGDFEDITTEEITTIKATDIVIPEVKIEEKRRIGFAC